jgi:ABC-type multidrug transport system fused ATPase/permease subunit
MIKTSFKYFYTYLGPKIFIMLMLSMLVGIFDGLGLTMFLPLIQMASGDPTVNSEALGGLGFIIDGFKWLGLDLNLYMVLITMLIFFLFKGILSFISGYVKVILEQTFISKIRFNLLRLLNGISYKSFMGYDIGRMQNTMTGEVGRVVGSYNSYFATFEQLVLVVVYMSFAFFVNPGFAILISIGGLITSVIYKHIYSATRDTSAELTKSMHSFQGLIVQHTAHFKYLKATGYLKRFGDKLDHTVLMIQKSNTRIGMLRAFLQASREPLLIFVVVIVIIVQTKFLGAILGSILVSLLFFYRSLTYLLAMQTQWNQFIAVSGSMDNMTSFQHDLEQTQEENGTNAFRGFKNNIEMVNISLNYDKQPALKNINIKINKNEVIAFVGVSGSGKTSLINLLAGLIPPDYGEILIDGEDLSKINKIQYQKKIGYITQDPVIFNDTIFNNVSLWSKKDEENIQKFRKVLKLANIDRFVESLPDKECTVLGYNGVNLSGGQRQRLSIARELFKDIEILIMDEATSSLDSETEYVIKKNIESIKGIYTLFIVAHRLSTIKSVDKIVMLSEGNVEFVGNFDTLKRNVPDFARMVDLQGI